MLGFKGLGVQEVQGSGTTSTDVECCLLDSSEITLQPASPDSPAKIGVKLSLGYRRPHA